MNRRRKFLWETSNYCSVEQDTGGGDSGGGAGGGSDGGPSATSEPSTESPAVEVNWGSEYKPSPNKMRAVLKKETDPNHSLTLDEIRTYFAFDSGFGKQPTQTQESQASEPETPEQNQQQPAGEKVEQQQQQSEALSPDVKALVSTLEKLAAQPAPAQQGQTEQKQEAPKPYYGGVVPAVQVHPELTKAIFNPEASDEQRGQALNYLISGMMNRVIQDTARLMLEVRQDVMTQVPQVAQQQYATQTSAQVFFAEYPELNKQAIHPVLSAITNQVLVSRKQRNLPTNLTPDVMKEIADATHLYMESSFGVKLPRKGQQTVTPAQQQQQQVVKPNGKFFTPNGVRPPAASAGSSKSAALLDMI